MQLKLHPNDTLEIRGEIYSVLPHPALPKMAFKQTGGRGSVFKLAHMKSNAHFALKVFTLSYQNEQVLESAKALASLKGMAGLEVANRKVLQPAKDATLIQNLPALKYAVLMQWIQGKTWYEIITKPEQHFTIEQSKENAYQLVTILANLEQRGLAHCDIAGGNVVIDLAAKKVTLIDIEEMYGAHMPQPASVPAGQAGYQHRMSQTTGNWNIYGDRFAGAIILAEMLAWHNQSIRQLSGKEFFFEQCELQTPNSLKFGKIYHVLSKEYSPDVANLFKKAWQSSTLAECPTMLTWKDAIESANKVVYTIRSLTPLSPGTKRRHINKLITQPIQNRRTIRKQ